MALMVLPLGCDVVGLVGGGGSCGLDNVPGGGASIKSILI